MPPQIKLLNFSHLIQRDPSALTCVGRVPSCFLQPTLELLRLSVVIPHENIVYLLSPPDIVLKPDNFLVTLSASQFAAALLRHRIQCDSILKTASTDTQRKAFA